MSVSQCSGVKVLRGPFQALAQDTFQVSFSRQKVSPLAVKLPPKDGEEETMTQRDMILVSILLHVFMYIPYYMSVVIDISSLAGSA